MSVSLETTYLGLKLSSPLIPSASPLSKSLDTVKVLEEMGAGAIVLYSLFEEDIEKETSSLEQSLTVGAESFAEALSYVPDVPTLRIGPDYYLDHLMRVKQSVGIPVIASLNAQNPGQWIKFAKLIEEAGADGLELNLYSIPTIASLSSQELEKKYLEVIKACRQAVKIPIAVKLSPFFTNFFSFSSLVEQTEVNGLVLFNRFFQPDIDLENMNVEPRITLSTENELLLRITWIGILFNRLKLDLSATGGVLTATDALKAILSGATTVQLCSALLYHGVEYLKTIRNGMVEWMEKKGYYSVSSIRGLLSQKNCPDPSSYERAQYVYALSVYPTPSLSGLEKKERG
ncbi:dihydroorotate dehydrogenase-like protein [Methylacidiphilum caldifontis]|uniref:Dihydroorotate dehydrogenase n=1 Tax=Methylacidiphilum caldifontis TaxID=2795386 RepID=A0A4Y8PC45_9BACT|nr:dihydroorotate dehydrogenase-like protein [Methylacidiphilum caldifontis]QSR87960.1 dihydroorotate dehydrogenase-like protein [Methylacidiphilum caldifontis]TFE68721.1 dihydroorotate dehydrogenase [Methylacidiphilum caldifontis]